MSIENPNSSRPETRSELSSYERLMVASENILDQIGRFRDGDEPFRHATWDDDESGHRFELTCVQNGEVYSYDLKVIRLFSRNHILERYSFNNVLREVDTSDELGKSLNKACSNQEVATLLRYVGSAISQDAVTNDDFLRLMTENGIQDPRFTARIRAFAKGIFGLR